MKVTKKLCLIILIFTGFHIFSQSSGTYDQIVNFIHQKHPEINTENKLIALCVWSSDNAESRETNKEYNRLYHVYQEAILKDARKGMGSGAQLFVFRNEKVLLQFE